MTFFSRGYTCFRPYRTFILSSGDFDDIVANAVGVVPVFITSEDVKLTGDAESSIAGRSLVIHEQSDDSRLKCCIIAVDYIPPKISV